MIGYPYRMSMIMESESKFLTVSIPSGISEGFRISFGRQPVFYLNEMSFCAQMFLTLQFIGSISSKGKNNM